MRLSNLALCAVLSLPGFVQAEGQTYRKKTTYEFSKQELREALPAPKEHKHADYQEAWRLFSQGQHDEAMRLMAKVIGDKAASASLVQDATAELLLFYAWSRPATGARAFLAESLGARLDEAMSALGATYHRLGKEQEAITIYGGLLSLYPESLTAQHGLCVSLLAVDFYQSENALTALQRLAALSQKAPPGEKKRMGALLTETATEWHRAAMKTRNKEHYLRAEKVYRSYLANFPEAEDAYSMTWNLAELLYYLFEQTRDLSYATAAGDFYERVIAINPAGRHTAEAALSVVVLFQQSKESDPKESIRKHQLFLQYAPTDEQKPIAYHQLGLAYQALQQPDEALASFRESIKLNPQSSVASAAAGAACDLLVSRGKPDEALRYLIQVEQEGVSFDKELLQKQARLQLRACEDLTGKEGAACYEAGAEGLREVSEKAEALYRAGLLYRSAKKPGKALALFTQLGALPYNAKLGGALLQSGEVHAELLDFDSAAKDLERFANELPGEVAAPSALRAAARYRAALGEYDASVEDLKKYFMVASKQKVEKSSRAQAFFQIAQTRHQEAKESPSRANQKKAATAYEQYLRDYASEGDTGLSLQARARVAGYLRADGKQAEADKECQAVVALADRFMDDAPDQARVTEQLGAGVDAAAECQFYLTERAYEAFTTRKAPQTPTPAKLLVWVEETRKTREDLTARYLKIKGYNSNEWTLAALYRIGMMSSLFADELRKHPDAAAFAEPIQEDAATAFSRCVEGSLQARWYNEWSAKCEEQLSALAPEAWPRLTEWTPEPTYEIQTITPALITKP